MACGRSLGQGSNPHLSCNLPHSCSNTRSLTHKGTSNTTFSWVRSKWLYKWVLPYTYWRNSTFFSVLSKYLYRQNTLFSETLENYYICQFEFKQNHNKLIFVHHNMAHRNSFYYLEIRPLFYCMIEDISYAFVWNQLEL